MARLWEQLDAWLAARGMWHATIGPMLRNTLLLALGGIFMGGLILPFTAWLFWFGMGAGAMALVFWSWARFLLPRDLAHPEGIVFFALLRWMGRLGGMALGLYLALTVFGATPGALLLGITANVALGLASFACATRRQNKVGNRV